MIKHKHQQLYDLLREELRRGTWPCNEKLPNLKELAARYDVSINVASKAVELLKEANLVSVKVGDGIYSETSGQPSLSEFKYSGERLFGQYGGAKELHVLMEDCTDWQMAFWDVFFAGITKENPDIELKVSYNTKELLPEQQFDLALGAPEYLSRNGFSPHESLSTSILETFYPTAYNGLLLQPGQLSWCGNSCYFPYGFENYQLLTSGETPEPLPGENVLGYMERLAADSPVPLGYGIHNSRGFLLNSGLEFVNSEHGVFALSDSQQTLAIFERARRLFQAGHLIWPHGRFSDYQQIYNLEEDQPIRIVEYSFNRGSQNELDKLLKRNLKLLPYPAGKRPLIIAEAAAISRTTRFPEECLRIIVALLKKRTQQQMCAHRIARPLHRELFGGEAYLADQLSRYRLDGLSIPDLKLHQAVQYFFSWEFLYYLSGRRQGEVIRFINEKIKYYLLSQGVRV